MAKNIKGPQFLRFIRPVIDVLRTNGGSAKSSDVIDEVLEVCKISDEEYNAKLKSGESRVRNQIQWARMYLVNAGYINRGQRGQWTLTEKALGSNLSESDVFSLFREVQDSFKESTSSETVETVPTAEQLDEKPTEEYSFQSSLIRRLKDLSASGFEKVCRRLLSECGLEQVEVTGKSGDGGIDGHGLLELNPLVRVRVIFQCKKYEKSVTPSHVRDFRGAMQGRAEKGIFITTGYFTPDAKKEAVRDGVPAIELVDGEKLVELFQKYSLGVQSKTVYEIDPEFFKHYE